MASTSIEGLFRAAQRAARAEDWVGAQEALAAVQARFPANKRAAKALAELRPAALPGLLAQAQAAQQQGEWALAERHLLAAAALAPDLVDVVLALVACQLQLGRAPAALAGAERVLAQAPENVRALLYRGRALRGLGQNGAAEASFRAALAQAPEEANLFNNLGITARARGDRAAALAHYRRALELAPRHPELLHNLAQSAGAELSEAELARMKDLAREMGEAPEAAPLHFGLFTALDRRGAPGALEHLHRGNRLALKAAPYDFKRDALAFALAKTLLPEAAAPVTEPPLAQRPIFVTGLPRTGTTLVERMLSRDPQVQPAGELTLVQLAVGRLLRAVTGRAEKRLTAADLASLRAELVAGLAAYGDGRPVIIDKMPLNFRFIGLICAALPEARIVHMTRDPVATAWSLYRHSFEGAGNGFVYSFEDIARFMVLHRNYMAHWEAILPGRVFELSYEALVADPAGQGQALAAATGLDWSADWLAPEAAAGQVLTASAEQVQRPIYGDSNAGWRRYEEGLAPLVAALEGQRLLAGAAVEG